MVLVFELRSVRRFFTTLAETWSLNAMTIRMGGLLVSGDGMCCWSATVESMNCLTARLKKYLGYLSFKNTVSSRSHSCEKYDQSKICGKLGLTWW